MNENRLRLAIVIGGPDRTDRAAADWLAGRMDRRGDAEVDLIDLAAACLPDARCGERYGSTLPTPPAVRDLTPWLADADGFVIVLGNGSINPVRNAVEWCAQGWQAKPVAFTRAGDAPGEPQLRTTFAAVPSVTLREAVRFHDQDRGHQADLMLDELVWWARPLRAARATTRYPIRRK